MNINNSNNVVQGNFNFNSKNKTIEQKNATTLSSGGSSYDKIIGNLELQIEKVKNSDEDEDVKKTKISDLQIKIADVKKSKQVEEAKNLSKEELHAQSADGDQLILSKDMQNMLNSDIKMKKLEEKDTIDTKIEGKSEILASEIETDKGRGLDTTKKEEELSELKEKLSNDDEDILEEMSLNSEEKLNESATENKRDNTEITEEDKIKTILT